MKNELSSYVNKLCANFNLEFREESENYFSIETDNASGLTLFLKIEESKKISFYYQIRTYDIFYSGDRTDAHVILSLMYSIFLKLSVPNVSVSIFDIPHPVIENEISGRYIMPEQVTFSKDDNLKQRIFKLIATVGLWRSTFWEIVGCPCEECLKIDNLISYDEGFMTIKNDRDYEIDNSVRDIIEDLYSDSLEVNCGSRLRPKYDYYYDMKNEVTVIKSKHLSEFVKTLYNTFNYSPQKIKGINGSLIIDDKVYNFISNKTKKELKKISKALTGEKTKYPIITLENMLVALANPYIIALGRLSGFSEYKTERELVRNRHNLESEILFPIPTFIWEDKVCPEQFENLIKSLLERENYIRAVRKPAPINQGDKGRDLIIEWILLDEKVISKNHPPLKAIKVVGQCKTSIKTIGKNKVIDIRDTVETHNSSGYFLAVNTQISASLTEKLESLRDKNIWTNWWNRDDIELRLTKNQDLISKFPKVLKVKHKVKFVEKD